MTATNVNAITKCRNAPGSIGLPTVAMPRHNKNQRQMSTPT